MIVASMTTVLENYLLPQIQEYSIGKTSKHYIFKYDEWGVQTTKVARATCPEEAYYLFLLSDNSFLGNFFNACKTELYMATESPCVRRKADADEDDDSYDAYEIKFTDVVERFLTDQSIVFSEFSDYLSRYDWIESHEVAFTASGIRSTAASAQQLWILFTSKHLLK